MLLPLMLRTLIEGSGMQGRTSQRELEHVRRGVDGTSRLAESEALAAPDDSPIAVARRRASKRTGTPSHAHEEPIEEAEDDAEDDNMTIRQNSSYWATGRGQGKGTSDGVSARGSVKIGFFLHTPFPSSEIYR
jgi:trehalose 6-phosphate synthase